MFGQTFRTSANNFIYFILRNMSEDPAHVMYEIFRSFDEKASLMDPFREGFDPRQALSSLVCPFDVHPSTSFDFYETELAADEPEIVRALQRIDDGEFASLSTADQSPAAASKRARLKRLAEMCAEGKTPTDAKPKRTVKKRVQQLNSAGGGRAFLCTSGSVFLKLEAWMRQAERVNVKLRGQSSLSTANVANRLLQGVIVAFDKHWNLLMTDIDEIYTPPVRLKKVQASARAMPPGVVYTASTHGGHYMLQRELPCSLITGSSVICIYRPSDDDDGDEK